MIGAINKHLMPFIGYFLAFVSPIGWFVWVIEVVMVAEVIFANLAYRSAIKEGDAAFKEQQKNALSWKKALITTALYVWLIMILRVAEVAFLKDSPILSKIVAGYITWNHVKQLIKNIDAYNGSNLWGQIEGTINKIKL